MSKKQLNEKQLMAIEYLAVPGRGGLTYEQIAEEVGVTDRQLRTWRRDDLFIKELRDTIVRKSAERMPELFDAAFSGVIEDRNAAMFRTLLQANGMLAEKIEIDAKEAPPINTDELREKLRRLKAEAADKGE